MAVHDTSSNSSAFISTDSYSCFVGGTNISRSEIKASLSTNGAVSLVKVSGEDTAVSDASAGSGAVTLRPVSDHKQGVKRALAVSVGCDTLKSSHTNCGSAMKRRSGERKARLVSASPAPVDTTGCQLNSYSRRSTTGSKVGHTRVSRFSRRLSQRNRSLTVVDSACLTAVASGAPNTSAATSARSSHRKLNKRAETSSAFYADVNRVRNRGASCVAPLETVPSVLQVASARATVCPDDPTDSCFACHDLDHFLAKDARLEISFAIGGDDLAATVRHSASYLSTGQMTGRLNCADRPATPAKQSLSGGRFKTLLERNFRCGLVDPRLYLSKQNSVGRLLLPAYDHVTVADLRTAVYPQPAKHTTLDYTVQRAGRTVPLRAVLYSSLTERKSWDCDPSRGSKYYVYHNSRQIAVRHSESWNQCRVPYTPHGSPVNVTRGLTLPTTTTTTKARATSAGNSGNDAFDTVVVDYQAAVAIVSAVQADTHPAGRVSPSAATTSQPSTSRLSLPPRSRAPASDRRPSSVPLEDRRSRRADLLARLLEQVRQAHASRSDGQSSAEIGSRQLGADVASLSGAQLTPSDPRHVITAERGQLTQLTDKSDGVQGTVDVYHTETAGPAPDSLDSGCVQILRTVSHTVELTGRATTMATEVGSGVNTGVAVDSGAPVGSASASLTAIRAEPDYNSALADGVDGDVQLSRHRSLSVPADADSSQGCRADGGDGNVGADCARSVTDQFRSHTLSPRPQHDSLDGSASCETEVEVNFFDIVSESSDDGDSSDELDVCQERRVRADSGTAESSVSTACRQPHCLLGCVCDSLACSTARLAHCGKSDCMFGCLCDGRDTERPGAGGRSKMSLLHTLTDRPDNSNDQPLISCPRGGQCRRVDLFLRSQRSNRRTRLRLPRAGGKYTGNRMVVRLFRTPVDSAVPFCVWHERWACDDYSGRAHCYLDSRTGHQPLSQLGRNIARCRVPLCSRTRPVSVKSGGGGARRLSRDSYTRDRQCVAVGQWTPAVFKQLLAASLGRLWLKLPAHVPICALERALMFYQLDARRRVTFVKFGYRTRDGSVSMLGNLEGSDCLPLHVTDADSTVLYDADGAVFRNRPDQSSAAAELDVVGNYRVARVAMHVINALVRRGVLLLSAVEQGSLTAWLSDAFTAATATTPAATATAAAHQWGNNVAMCQVDCVRRRLCVSGSAVVAFSRASPCLNFIGAIGGKSADYSADDNGCAVLSAWCRSCGVNIDHYLTSISMESVSPSAVALTANRTATTAQLAGGNSASAVAPATPHRPSRQPFSETQSPLLRQQAVPSVSDATTTNSAAATTTNSAAAGGGEQSPKQPACGGATHPSPDPGERRRLKIMVASANPLSAVSGESGKAALADPCSVQPGRPSIGTVSAAGPDAHKQTPPSGPRHALAVSPPQRMRTLLRTRVVPSRTKELKPSDRSCVEQNCSALSLINSKSFNQQHLGRRCNAARSITVGRNASAGSCRDSTQPTLLLNSRRLSSTNGDDVISQMPPLASPVSYDSTWSPSAATTSTASNICQQSGSPKRPAKPFLSVTSDRPQHVPSELCQLVVHGRPYRLRKISLHALPDVMQIDSVPVSLTRRYVRHMISVVRKNGAPVTISVKGVALTMLWLATCPQAFFIGTAQHCPADDPGAPSEPISSVATAAATAADAAAADAAASGPASVLGISRFATPASTNTDDATTTAAAAAAAGGGGGGGGDGRGSGVGSGGACGGGGVGARGGGSGGARDEGVSGAPNGGVSGVHFRVKFAVPFGQRPIVSTVVSDSDGASAGAHSQVFRPPEVVHLDTDSDSDDCTVLNEITRSSAAASDVTSTASTAHILQTALSAPAGRMSSDQFSTCFAQHSSAEFIVQSGASPASVSTAAAAAAAVAPLAPPVPHTSSNPATAAVVIRRRITSQDYACVTNLRNAQQYLKEVLCDSHSGAANSPELSLSGLLKLAVSEIDRVRRASHQLTSRRDRLSLQQEQLIATLNGHIRECPLESRIERAAEMEENLPFLQVFMCDSEQSDEPLMMLAKKSAPAVCAADDTVAAGGHYGTSAVSAAAVTDSGDDELQELQLL